MRTGCSADDSIRLRPAGRTPFATGTGLVLQPAISERGRNRRRPVVASCLQQRAAGKMGGVLRERVGRRENGARARGAGGFIPLYTLYTLSTPLSLLIPAPTLRV